MKRVLLAAANSLSSCVTVLCTLDYFPVSLLSDVPSDAGGETAMPLAYAIDATRQPIAHLSACANRQGISVVPEKV